MIPTVSDSQTQILRWIMDLYSIEEFTLDPTYGKGGFYRDGRIPPPLLMGDICPRRGRHGQAVNGVGQIDSRDLRGIDIGSISSIVFDPPFIHAHGKDSVIGNRFGSYPSQKALGEMYQQSMEAFYRVLKPGGILVLKCQDIVESGKQVMSHCLIWSWAVALGFEVLDLFVLMARHRMRGHNHGRQVHARKYHAYFWVFRKRCGRSEPKR